MHEERQTASTLKDSLPGPAKPLLAPWDWHKEHTSIALFTSPSGANWVRVQHRDGSQKLVPWPQFVGWEHALPAEVGVPDISIGAIAVFNIVEAIRILKQNGFDDPVVGSWQDVLSRCGRPRCTRGKNAQRHRSPICPMTAAGGSDY